MKKLYKKKIITPIGEMIAMATDEAICLLDFFDSKTLLIDQTIAMQHFKITDDEEKDTPLLLELAHQLNEYFAKERKEFTLPIELIGTSFLQKVWKMLQIIPYGETRTYKEQAIAVGNPKGVRAVANANAKNRISIIVPCHRVIGTNGTLTGYAGGLDRKKFLLDLERQNL
ncbi:methylated-DNA--[protein]-cysteine S-methyltransferase [Capnocytophaga leadbetteri]